MQNECCAKFNLAPPRSIANFSLKQILLMEGMTFSWPSVFVASLMPMILGMLYYHPSLLGSVWMRANGFSMDTLTPPRPLLYGVAWLLSFFLAFWCKLQFLDVHQTSMNPDGSEYNGVTYGHGVAHGVIYSIMVVLPILGISAIFEKRSLSWVGVNWGYWLLTLSAICAIVCGWR